MTIAGERLVLDWLSSKGVRCPRCSRRKHGRTSCICSGDVELRKVVLQLGNIADPSGSGPCQPAWVPWLFGFILLLFSLIGASFVLTLEDGDRNIRYYLSLDPPMLIGATSAF
ncbi:hypothetical protein ACVWZ8_003061 [Arthrobacter sp. UYCu723]